MASSSVWGNNSPCVLCGSPSREEHFGKFFLDRSTGISVHQYCMFFASALEQHGEDVDGFDGFLLEDLRTEVNRSKKLQCSFCKRKGASIGCCFSKCKSKFHFNCGYSNGSLFQFYGSFNSYCRKHRPKQKTFAGNPCGHECRICLSEVTDTDGLDSLMPPCCKNGLFHRTCLQKQANASGLYFFRCPVCNDTDSFQKEMKRMGIFIPERDALWEQGDAYADLLYRHNSCDAHNCKCKYGRKHSADKGPWKICLCFVCGQHGTHLRCQRWKTEPLQWICNICAGGFEMPSKTLDQVIGDQSKSADLSEDTSESASEDSSSVLCITDDESEEDLPLVVSSQGKAISKHSSNKKNTDCCIHIKDTDSEDTSSEIDVEAIDERYKQTREKEQITEKDMTKVGKKRCPCCQKLQQPTDQRKKRQCPIDVWLRGDDLKGNISTSPLPTRGRVHSRSSFTTVKAKFSKKTVGKNGKKNCKYQDSGVRKNSVSSILTISDTEDEAEITKTSAKAKCLEDQKTSVNEETSINAISQKTSSVVIGQELQTTFQNSSQPEKIFNDNWHWSGGYLEKSLQRFYYLRSRNHSTKTHECLKKFPSDHLASS